MQQIWEVLETAVSGPERRTVLSPQRRLQLSDALQEQGWRKKTVRLSDNSTPKRYVRADVVGVVATTPNRTVGGHRVSVSQCENPEKPLNHRKNTHSISDTETPVVATTPTTKRPQDDHNRPQPTPPRRPSPSGGLWPGTAPPASA